MVRTHDGSEAHGITGGGMLQSRPLQPGSQMQKYEPLTNENAEVPPGAEHAGGESLETRLCWASRFAWQPARVGGGLGFGGGGLGLGGGGLLGGGGDFIGRAPAAWAVYVQQEKTARRPTHENPGIIQSVCAPVS